MAQGALADSRALGCNRLSLRDTMVNKPESSSLQDQKYLPLAYAYG